MVKIWRTGRAHPHQGFLEAPPGLNDTFEDTAISRKVVGKCAGDNPDRVLWVVLILKRMARETMDVCLRVLKESIKSRFDSYSVRNRVYIDHIPYYLPELLRAHFFRQPFSK